MEKFRVLKSASEGGSDEGFIVLFASFQLFFSFLAWFVLFQICRPPLLQLIYLQVFLLI